MNRILVTGASGFIGTSLVHTLSDQGFSVIGIDRYLSRQPLPCERFVQADLLDTASLRDALKGVNTIYHLAALPAIARARQPEYERVNVSGTDQLLLLARDAGVEKVVHMSSSTIYGIPDVCPIAEDATMNPKNPYSQSKAKAEKVAQDYAQEGMDITIIRPRVVLGTGRAGIFALLFSLIRKGLPIPLPGGGKNLFQFTAVADLVDACLLAAAETSPGECQIYNVGSSVNRPMIEEIRELVLLAQSRSLIVRLPAKPVRGALVCLHAIGLSPLVPEQYQIMDTDFVLDTTRAKKRLGFHPKHANGDGLMEAWKWWRENASEGGIRDLLRWWKPRHQNALQDRPKS